MAECFGRGQVSTADSQADSTDCQALLHPRGLRIVFLGVIFVLGIPSARAPKGPPSSCPGPEWPSEAALGPGQGSCGGQGVAPGSMMGPGAEIGALRGEGSPGQSSGSPSWVKKGDKSRLGKRKWAGLPWAVTELPGAWALGWSRVRVMALSRRSRGLSEQPPCPKRSPTGPSAGQRREPAGDQSGGWWLKGAQGSCVPSGGWSVRVQASATLEG